MALSSPPLIKTAAAWLCSRDMARDRDSREKKPVGRTFDSEPDHSRPASSARQPSIESNPAASRPPENDRGVQDMVCIRPSPDR